MAITVAVTSSCELPNGERLIKGTFTWDASYATGGEVADISQWLSGTPHVDVSPGDDGYVPQTDRGTAAAQKVLLFEAGADAAALDEVGAATDVSAVITYFSAQGTAV